MIEYFSHQNLKSIDILFILKLLVLQPVLLRNLDGTKTKILHG